MAAKELFISQPAVSQQIAMLEASVGYQLFVRKSKGVEPTEYAKLLNNLIIEALERLENVESGFKAKAVNTERLFSVGISKHLMSSIGNILVSKFDSVDFTFHENEALFEMVDSKKIDFALVTKKFDTFDTIQVKIREIKQVLVASKDLDCTTVKADIKKNDLTRAEQWLNKQKWFSHDARIPHIKLFWLYVFDKKRPSMEPNYIIPSEYEMLQILSKNTGVAIAWDCNVQPFLINNQLQVLWDSKKMPHTELFLLSRKNRNLTSIFEEIVKVLKTEKV